MLRSRIFGCLISVVLLSTASGTSVVGKASCQGSFELRGTTVPGAGIPFWPLTEGDEVAATGAPVILTMRDGTRLMLPKGSRIRIGTKDGKLIVHALSGPSPQEPSAHPTLSFASIFAKAAGDYNTVGLSELSN